METTEKPVTTKEGCCSLRKKAKRLKQSRDNLKAKNCEKTSTIKKLRDRLTELESSRDHWRAKNSQALKECRVLEAEQEQTANEVKSLKEEYNLLQQEVERLKKKKKSQLFW